MSVEFIIDELLVADIYNQVTALEVSVGKPSLDTAKELTTLLRPLFTGGSFDPLTLGTEPVHPSLVYQLVSSGWLRLQGYAVAYSETYVLYIRTADVPTLVSQVDSVVSTIEASGHAIELNDMLTDYDDVQKLYRCNMEIAFTQAAGNALIPACLVYPLAIDGEPNVYDGDCSQRRVNTYGVISLTVDNDVQNLRALAEAALVGAQVDTQHTQLQLRSGAPLELPGGLQGWQDIYSETQYTAN